MCSDGRRRWTKIARELPVEVLWLPLLLLCLVVLPVGVAVVSSALVAILLQLSRLWRQRGVGSWIQALAQPLLVSALLYTLAQMPWIEGRGILLLHVLAIVLISQSLLVSQSLNLDRVEQDEECSCTSARQKVLRLEGWRICKKNLLLGIPSLALSTLCICCDFSLGYHMVLAWINVLVFALWAIYKCVYLGWMIPRLEQEEWVPVMDAEERIVGLTPVSALDCGEGRLPVVRLLLLAEGMIYLEHLPSGEAEDERRVYDTPFASWRTDGHSAEEVAQTLLEDRCCGLEVPLLRLSPYKGKHLGRESVIYLFVAILDDPRTLRVDCLPSEGKWWCARQLKEQIDLCPEDFTETLREEYLYLEQTILLAHRL